MNHLHSKRGGGNWQTSFLNEAYPLCRSLTPSWNNEVFSLHHPRLEGFFLEGLTYYIAMELIRMAVEKIMNSTLVAIEKK